MSGHLSLKWNNHSSAFLRSISRIQMKERYCDSTIVCQGKYFPVHRIILSTCSAYFDEIFERMNCQHPYIIFKDIEAKEMELLLNYMYQGEVNVVQEMLPSLIKAAESLRIKGLAEPDDIVPRKKRSSPSDDGTNQPKKRNEDKNENSSLSAVALNKSGSETFDHQQNFETNFIKEEPVDPSDFDDKGVYSNYTNETFHSANDGPSLPFSNQSVVKDIFTEQPEGTSHCLKEEIERPLNPYDNQSGEWNNFSAVRTVDHAPPAPSVGSEEQNMLELDARAMPLIHPLSLNAQGLSNFSSDSFSRAPMRSHKCPFCHYESDKKTNVKRHIMHKHTGERPFNCPICPARFTEKISLHRHKLRVHNVRNYFECGRCPQKFTRYSLLKEHLFNYH